MAGHDYLLITCILIRFLYSIYDRNIAELNKVVKRKREKREQERKRDGKKRKGRSSNKRIIERVKKKNRRKEN